MLQILPLIYLQFRLRGKTGHRGGGRFRGDPAGGLPVIEEAEQPDQQDDGHDAEYGEADAEKAHGKGVDVLRLLSGAGRRAASCSRLFPAMFESLQ